MRRLLALVIALVPATASPAGVREEVDAAVAEVRAASEAAGERLGHALSEARRVLERVQSLLDRRRLAEARAFLPLLRVRVEAVKAARRVVELEDRARALERESVEIDEDARVAKDAYERAIEVRRELEARP